MSNIKAANYYKNTRPEIMSVIDFIPKDVLEIGCGQGNFGKGLKLKYQCSVTGIEINEDQAKVAAKNLDKVYASSVEEAIYKLRDKQFDLIVANDVLEHLQDPYEVIKKLSKKLARNGRIISSIPNVRNFHVVYALLRNKEWKYTESGILDFTHLRFFTCKSIIEMYESNGYKIVKQQGINKDNNLPWWFKMVRFIFNSRFEDMSYLQFVTVAELK